MKAIQEMISLLQKLGAITYEPLHTPFKKHSRTRQFFYFLLDHPLEDDQAAAGHFFQEKPSSLIYRRAKRSLMEQLVQTLFLVDGKKIGDNAFQRAYYYCWRNMCAAKILLGYSAHHTAILLLKKILARANRYELSDLSLECYKILRWYYACMDGNRVQYQKYDHFFHVQKKICHAEQIAEDYYTSISSVYLSDKSQRYFLANQALKYWQEIADLMEQYPSSRLHFLGNLIHVYHYTCAGDYEGAIGANEMALRFFEKKEGPTSFYQKPFLNHQLACFIILKNFEAGRVLVKKLDQRLQPGSFDWFVSRQLYFILAMHTQNFEQARGILNQVVAHRQFKYLPRTQAEKWIINQAYLYYLEISGHLSQPIKIKGAFKAKHFLRAVPLYSKDKRGMNVPILIISILILLAKRKYNELIDRVDALEKYRGRYLRMEDAYRSNCFIKMLVMIPRSDFHPALIERNVEKIKENLDKVPLQGSTQAYELEIIPYEDLWAMVLKSLKFYQGK